MESEVFQNLDRSSLKSTNRHRIKEYILASYSCRPRRFVTINGLFLEFLCLCLCLYTWEARAKKHDWLARCEYDVTGGGEYRATSVLATLWLILPSTMGFTKSYTQESLTNTFAVQLSQVPLRPKVRRAAINLGMESHRHVSLRITFA